MAAMDDNIHEYGRGRQRQLSSELMGRGDCPDAIWVMGRDDVRNASSRLEQRRRQPMLATTTADVDDDCDG
ncbi:hypothetical protein U1Q18_021832 [Sarracenia purpurea var. burkii]